MKKDMLDIVCCPVCKTSLKLKVEEEKDDEIIQGVFTCAKCKQSYPIMDGIPSLIPK